MTPQGKEGAPTPGLASGYENWLLPHPALGHGRAMGAAPLVWGGGSRVPVASSCRADPQSPTFSPPLTLHLMVPSPHTFTIHHP